MKHLDLFSGIGGFALACQWAGIETIGFVEIDKYCQKVLRKHWPSVPIVEDIRDVERIKEITADTTRGRLQQCECQGESSHDSSQVGEVGRWRGHNGGDPAILVTAGFPCQPFSVAGKRGGEADDRYLWPETLAVIEAIKPEWVLLENVTGIINLAIDTVLSDLERQGYSWETLIIPACAVNAWHRRDRVWIMAHSDKQGLEGGTARIQQGLGHRFERCNPVIANSKGWQPWEPTEPEGWEDTSRGSQENGDSGDSNSTPQEPIAAASRPRNPTSESGWWAAEPELGRVAHGISHRVDRLKCLGNAIVPQVAYEIIKAIVEIDKLIPQ